MLAFAYVDDVSLCHLEVTANTNTARVYSFLRRELLIDDVRSVGKPANTLALPPQGNAPTAKNISLPEKR